MTRSTASAETSAELGDARDAVTRRRSYEPLDLDGAIELARQCLPGAARAEVAGSGNVNSVFRVYDSGSRSVVVKQALPYLKVVGESWPLSLDRARIEAESLTIANEVVPELSPRLLAYNSDLAALIIEDLRAHEVWREALMGQRLYPGTAGKIGSFCAVMAHHTSDLGMDRADRKLLGRRFVNPSMCAITEQLVFTDPFVNAASNRFDAALGDEVRRMWADATLCERVARLRFAFCTRAEALIHADLHTGSVMVSDGDARVIDTEFSYMGPIAYDLGVMIGNLLISYVSHVRQGNFGFAASLTAATEEFWVSFHDEMRRRWPATEPWSEHFLAAALRDAGRYAGLKMVRRVVGLAHAPDLDEITDPQQRLGAQRDSLRVGCSLIQSHLRSLDHLWDLVGR